MMSPLGFQHTQQASMRAKRLFQGINMRTYSPARIFAALNQLGAALVPVEVLSQAAGETTWAESLTKLRIFQLTRYR